MTDFDTLIVECMRRDSQIDKMIAQEDELIKEQDAIISKMEEIAGVKKKRKPCRTINLYAIRRAEIAL